MKPLRILFFDSMLLNDYFKQNTSVKPNLQGHMMLGDASDQQAISNADQISTKKRHTTLHSLKLLIQFLWPVHVFSLFWIVSLFSSLLLIWYFSLPWGRQAASPDFFSSSILKFVFKSTPINSVSLAILQAQISVRHVSCSVHCLPYCLAAHCV